MLALYAQRANCSNKLLFSVSKRSFSTFNWSNRSSAFSSSELPEASSVGFRPP